MTDSSKTPKTQTPEKNGAQPATGLENGNGTRSAAGLVVAGLVTVVGSWIGMAAYMDFRLQGMEERISNETKQQVVSVADTTRTTMNKQLGQISQGITSKIEDTSSVLAKGLLDITQKEDEYYTSAIKELRNQGNEITSKIKEINDSSVTTLTGLITENDKALQADMAQRLQSVQDGFTQMTASVESTSQDLTESLQTVSRTTRTSNEAMLAAVQNLDNDLAEMNSGLLAHMDSNAKSLEDLVKLANEKNTEQLSELASNFKAVAAGASDGSKKLSSELTALAHKVTTLRSTIASSQSAIQELSANVPEWQKASKEQLQTITNSAKAINGELQTQVSQLNSKIQEMGQQIDNTSESLMRALYITSEGMEGTKIEIKSKLENSKQETAKEIRNLAQSLQDVSQQIENLQRNVSSQTTGSQSSSLPFGQSSKIEQLGIALNAISLKANDLRSQIDSQVKEVKTRTETLLGDANAQNPDALKEMLHDFTALADMAGGQLDSLLEGMQNLNDLVNVIHPNDAVQNSEKTVAVPQQASEDQASREIGMNPEDRIVDVQKVSMQ